MESFGAVLRKWRVARGWSQSELAASQHFSKKTISNVELGKRASRQFASVMDQALGAEGELVAAFDRTWPERQVARPAQLPASPTDFVGRRQQLAALDAAAAQHREPGVTPVVILSGPAGAGKTTLALKWAHQVAETFPDGALWACLSGEAVSPSEVLDGWLRALGVHGVAGNDHERAAQFRTATASRQMLVIIDDPTTVDHIIPLVPGGRSVVVVTTRHTLSSVDLPATHVPLGPLDSGEAYQWMCRMIGRDRVDAEPRAMSRILARCDRLPLALRLVAEHALRSPDMRLDALASQLEAENSHLDVLTTADTSMRNVLSLSYQRLTDDERRALRLLALHPGQALPVMGAAAAVLNLDQTVTCPLVSGLADAHLIAVDGGRLRLHETVGAYARERALQEETPDARRAAVRRLLDWYLATEERASKRLLPHTIRPDPPPHDHPVKPRSFAGYDEALTWCTAEADSVISLTRLARDAGFSRHAWLLAAGLFPYYFLRRPWAQWIRHYTLGLDAARDIDDESGIAWCQHSLGVAHYELRALDTAQTQLATALEIRQRIGEHRFAASSFFHLAAIYLDWRQHDQAESYLSKALAIFQDINLDYGVTLTEAWLGTTFRRQGRLTDARDVLERALQRCEPLNSGVAEAAVTSRLATVYRDLGRIDDALRCFRRAYELRVVNGEQWGQAEILLEQGRMLADLERHDEARCSMSAALEIYEDTYDPRAADARAELVVLESHRPVAPCHLLSSDTHSAVCDRKHLA